AAGVLSRAGHRLQGAELEVRRPPPWDPRKMMFCGLDVNTEEALLELYVEAVSGRDSVTIIQSKDRNSALLSFQEELSDEDFLRLESRVKEKRLLGREISVRRVRSSGDVLVEDLGSGISLDLLEMYFESKRSGGGAVTSVTFLRGNSAAIVSFRDWRVADEVLCRSHILQNCRLSVSRYHPDLIETAKSPDPESSQVIGAPDQQTPPPPQTQPNDQQTPPPPPLPSPPPTQLYHMAEETADHVQRIRPEVSQIRPEVSQIRPEVSQIRPEVSQIRPHCQDLCSPVYGNERTLSCHDTPDKGDRDADPGGSSMVWEAEGVTPVQEAEGVTPVQEEEVVMEEAELLFMQRYRHDLLAGMNNVTIFPLEERDKSGFKVIGDAFSCKTAVEVLQHVVSSLSSRSITLDYPGVSHFLLEREGKCTLRDIENHHQCIIDTSQISWNPLDCQFVDPWSLIGDTSSPELSDVQSMMIDEEPGDRSLHADLEGIKMFASLLKSEESAGDNLTNENKTSIGRKIEEDDLEEDLYTDRSLDLTSNQVKDEELQQVCEMSRKEFQERQLDEEAQILLAIQRSMDSRGISVQEEEEEDLQRALEMSLIQNESEDTEESLQRALEMSLQDQRSHDFQGSHDFHEPIAVSEDPASLQHMEATLDVVTLRVLAGDETGIVVASAALRKAITSKLNTVILEAMEGLQNISPIMAALHKKHKVKITESGRELQIQGFLQRPNQCRQEMSEILNILHSRDQTLNRVQSQASADVMKMDTDIDVQMTDVSETSEEYQHVTQPFLDTLRDLQPSIEILQVSTCNPYISV
ncbi:protein mono-ADP-ribosyltransferase PARP10-like, partial [Mantella aurantiaca]